MAVILKINDLNIDSNLLYFVKAVSIQISGAPTTWYDSKHAELKRNESSGSISLGSGNLIPTIEEISRSKTCLDNSSERDAWNERQQRRRFSHVCAVEYFKAS